MAIISPAFLLIGIGFPELLVLLFILLIGLGGTGLWIVALVDCITKEADVGNNKVVWVLVIALTHIVGAALYFIVRRPQRIAELGR